MQIQCRLFETRHQTLFCRVKPQSEKLAGCTACDGDNRYVGMEIAFHENHEISTI